MSLITHDGKIVAVDGKGLTFDQLRSELDTANGSESVTLAEAVENTEQAKTDISEAIIAKGGTVGASDGLEDFAAAIAGIPSGGSLPAEIVSVTEYTHAENWLSDTLGNTMNFAKTYLDFDTPNTNFYIAFVTGNTASQFKAGTLWINPTNVNGSTKNGGGTFGDGWSGRNIGTSSSFWISAGSKVVVVKLRSIFTAL